MERLITDIGQYGAMIEAATAALDEPIDRNAQYRDRQRQMDAERVRALTEFRADVASGGFPSDAEVSRIDPAELAGFRSALDPE